MPIADAQGVRRLLVRDLVLGARIGVHPHEHRAPQRVRLNLDLEVAQSGNPLADDLAQVVDYEALIGRVRRLVASRHVKLVVEPGGAVALATLLSGRFEARGRTVAIVLSGGNVDPEVFALALRRSASG